MQEPEATRPTHGIRWWILLMLFLAMTVNMLDRQVLSIVAPVLRDRFHFSDSAYGAIIFFFLLGMAAGQWPVGMMFDRRGARAGFGLILAYWSIVNMLHGLARSVLQFAGLRFLLGLGECGTYSGGVKVIGEWFPAKERALASGLFNSGSLVGAIFAPPLIVFLMLKYGWPAAFLIPGFFGLLWLVPWFRIYWEPRLHPRLTEADRRREAEAVAAGPGQSAAQPSVRMLLRLAPVWGVVLMRAFGGPVTHFYWYWLPEYLKHARGMSLEMIGLFAWMPFFSGGLGNIGGGWLSSRLIRSGWTVNWARKGVVILATALCLSAVLVPLAPNSASAIALICLASFGINAIAANLMGILADLFPQAILARVSGLTGIGDGLMSMTMMLVTGIVIDRFSYLPVFIAAGLFPVVTLAALMILVGRIRPLPLFEIMGEAPGPATPVTPDPAQRPAP
jgi:ACS family hexuronate transporter-like MFS transporter